MLCTVLYHVFRELEGVMLRYIIHSMCPFIHRHCPHQQAHTPPGTPTASQPPVVEHPSFVPHAFAQLVPQRHGVAGRCHTATSRGHGCASIQRTAYFHCLSPQWHLQQLLCCGQFDGGGRAVSVHKAWHHWLTTQHVLSPATIMAWRTQSCQSRVSDCNMSYTVSHNMS